MNNFKYFPQNFPYIILSNEVYFTNAIFCEVELYSLKISAKMNMCMWLQKVMCLKMSSLNKI